MLAKKSKIVSLPTLLLSSLVLQKFVIHLAKAAGECPRNLPNLLIMVNECPYPIWVGILGNGLLCYPEGGGFKLVAKTSKVVTVPTRWGGRVWGRPGCDEGGRNCDSGNCGNMGTRCAGLGTLYVTLGEVFFDRDNVGDTFYDLSLVDAYNMPMAIKPNRDIMNANAASCKIGTCNRPDLIQCCPSELAIKNKGKTVACQTDCEKYKHAYLDNGRPANLKDVYESNCCEGIYNRNNCNDPPTCRSCKNGPGTCKPCPTRRKNAAFFKNKCPSSYTYPNDDIGRENAQFSCFPKVAGRGAVDIVFCPGGKKSLEYGVGPLEGNFTNRAGCPAGQAEENPAPASGSFPPILAELLNALEEAKSSYSEQNEETPGNQNQGGDPETVEGTDMEGLPPSEGVIDMDTKIRGGNHTVY